jgi:hypothetical protein
MTALTKERNTLTKEIVHLDALPLAANTKIYAGAIVAVNAAGYAVPASTSTTIKAAGRAEETIDNTGGAAGDKKIWIRRGVHLYSNSGGGDAITIAERYTPCYLVDDQTVAKTDGTATRSIAGTIVDVEPAGVWVHIDPLRDNSVVA